MHYIMMLTIAKLFVACGKSKKTEVSSRLYIGPEESWKKRELATTYK